MTVFYIGTFGIVGIFLRYGMDTWIANPSRSFPLHTFLVNALGCFLAGAIYAVSSQGGLSPALQTGLLVGLCGGFTTFSAYALQAFNLLEKNQIGWGFLYFVLSPILGLLSVYLGCRLAQAVLR